MQRNIFAYFRPPTTAYNIKPEEETATSGQRDATDLSVQTEPVFSYVEPIGDIKMPQESERAESEYETRRLENMKRNADFLRQLGLNQVKSSLSSEQARPPTKKVKTEKPLVTVFPTRRSTRHTCAPVHYTESETIRDCSDVDNCTDDSEEESYDDSDVFRYVLSEMRGSMPKSDGDSFSESSCRGRLRLSRPTQSPHQGGEGLYCPELSAVYSMHVLEELPTLLLAAGKGGYVSLFRLPHDCHCGTDSDGARMIGVNETGTSVLMTFKAHSKWIGSAKLIKSPHCDRKNANIFAVTCADDASVKIWDISLCKSSEGNVGSLSKPLLVCESKDIHNKGIYCMDIYNASSMITGSKDKSVAVSNIILSTSGDGTAVRHNYVDLRCVSRFDVHSGVVKSVAWQRPSSSDGSESMSSPAVFASCGVDNTVVVKDIRSGQHRGDIILSGVYDKGGLHTVQWSPEREQADYMILAAGFSDTLKIFDLRKPDVDSPLFEFRGHCSNSSKKNQQAKQILQTPTFVKGKNCVATAGHGNMNVSIYSTITGSCISRGEIEDEPNAIYSIPSGVASRILVACKRGCIYPLDVLGVDDNLMRPRVL